MSGAAFAVFRGLTSFGDLPASGKALRVLCFPYFLAKALFAAPPPPGASLRALGAGSRHWTQPCA